MIFVAIAKLQATLIITHNHKISLSTIFFMKNKRVNYIFSL